MERNYLSPDIKITFCSFCTVNIELSNGEKAEDLIPKELFPVSRKGQYICLVNAENEEFGIIKNIFELEKDSREVLQKAIDEYFRVPKITEVLEIVDKFGLIKMKCNTDMGKVAFEIKQRYYNIKMLPDGRILIRDNNDNRYEIPDYDALDKKSRQLLYQYT